MYVSDILTDELILDCINSHDSMKAVHSPTQFLKEFRTLSINLGRRKGHSTCALSILTGDKYNVDLIVNSESVKHTLCNQIGRKFTYAYSLLDYDILTGTQLTARALHPVSLGTRKANVVVLDYPGVTAIDNLYEKLIAVYPNIDLLIDLR